MGRILQLSKNVINQIAAGEVIERPYSVVKELVENSVDAEASKISIEISNECRDIRVADNGSGIHPDDIVLAFSKHATSKIKNEFDLFNIKTMGFRGEALSSIISISKLKCTTRTKDFDYGTKVECENSEVKYSKTGCAIGTIMEIKDLFYNLPARLKFLKSAKTEFSYIYELIQSISLAHPNVSFELKNNGKTILKTSGQDSLIHCISEVFSDNITRNLKEVLKTDTLSGLSISGYVSTPDFTRASKKDYYMYVNSRAVKCPVFQKAIDTAYRNLTGNSRYPFIILNLNIPLQDIDVNVHPTKKEVRYKNPNQIFNFIYSSIDMALSGYTERVNKMSEPIPEQKEEYILKKPVYQTTPDINKKSETLQEEKYSSPLLVIPKPAARIEDTKQTTLVSQPKISQTTFLQNIENTYTEENIIGQYKKTYILIEKEEGIEIVDQHIADERYIYEKLKKSKNIDCQLLFISDIIEVSTGDKELLEQNKDRLLRFGYDIEFISNTEIIFKKIPQILSKISPKEILADILENLNENVNNIEEQILITTSCKAAVKANTYLTNFQMQEIIKNWRKCEKPFTCPHGRPISKIIEHKDIAHFFQRNK